MKPKLKPRDREILQLRILGDKKCTDVAAQVGVTKCTVVRTMNKDGAQEYIAELEAKRQKRYMDVYNKAFDVATDNVVECMEELANIALRGENERVRRDACRDIAYIAGLKPKEALSAGRTPKLIIEEKTEPKKGTWSA